MRSCSNGLAASLSGFLVSGRVPPRPRSWGWTWRLQAIGQHAAQPLPGIEQAGLGAQSLARGYTRDDGVYDRSLVLRNEAHAPTLSLERALAVAVPPYAFVDAGRASNLAAHEGQSASSIEAGLLSAIACRLF